MQDNFTQQLNGKENLEISPEVYAELVKIARSNLNRNKRHQTLDTCALVNESVLKFYQSKKDFFSSRGHFYALMSKIMRSLVIDYARKKSSEIHGGDLKKVTLTSLYDEGASVPMEFNHVLDIDNAMLKLAELDSRLEQMLMMKFYGGLTLPELAESFSTSESTIKRELRIARAFVQSQLKEYSEI